MLYVSSLNCQNRFEFSRDFLLPLMTRHNKRNVSCLKKYRKSRREEILRLRTRTKLAVHLCQKMRVVLWISALVLALCASHVLGQAKKKDSISLGEKVQQLIDSSAKRPVIRLNGNKFRDYVRNSPRNYSIVVMFTALSAQRFVWKFDFEVFKCPFKSFLFKIFP